MRIQELGRIRDGSFGSSPACDFQNAFFVRLHDIFVADPDDRVIFHVRSPTTPEPPLHHQGDTVRTEKKTTKG